MIRLLVVDDSLVVRKVFRTRLEQDADIHVVATAPDPYVARDLILEHQPDVVVLDLELPRMDGLTFLRKLMRYHPVPVVVVSSHTTAGSDLALEALEAGAVEVLGKPGPQHPLAEVVDELRAKIKAAAGASLGQRPRAATPVTDAAPREGTTAPEVVVGGASRGGTTALRTILAALPADAPPLLIVQHMPAGFTTTFASRLNGLAALEVREAQDGDKLRPGLALVAPGDRHLVVRALQDGLVARVREGPLVNHHRPSVDVLFRSAARELGDRALGVLLTGMGSDGAQGLLALRRQGATTVAQDRVSSVVYGMPKAAVDLGAAEHVASPSRIPALILRG